MIKTEEGGAVQPPRNQVLVGDAYQQLRRLPAGSVDMVLSSPPYFNLRSYLIDGQLGQEATIHEWVDNLRAVAQEVARVLTPTGTFWLNVGDTYSIRYSEGAAPKSLLLGPARLAIALSEDGWLIRNHLVWAKTNPIPNSVRDRLSTTHETVWLLAQQRRYFFDLDSIRIPHTSRVAPQADARRGIPREWRGRSSDNDSGLVALKRAGLPGHPLGRNPGDVWRLATSDYRGGHFATFPVQLATRAILAGCPEARCIKCRAPCLRGIRRLGSAAVRGPLQASCDCHVPSEPGLVLDPFMGAGTTGVAAEALNRDWLGIELNPEFAALAEERIAAVRRPTDAI